MLHNKRKTTCCDFAVVVEFTHQKPEQCGLVLRFKVGRTKMLESDI